MNETAGIAWYAHGSGGTPVVMLHSLGCDASMWRGVTDPLAENRRVITVDTRGHGASTDAGGPYTVDQLGEDVVAVADAAGLDEFDVVGLSLGGLMALWLACRHPQRIRRLVACATADKIGTEANWQARIDTIRRDGLDSVAPMVLGRFFSPRFRETQPDAIEAARATLVTTSVDGYTGCCHALGHADLRSETPSIRARTLLLAGGADVSTPPRLMREVSERIPGSRYAELPEAGHLLSIEDPDETLHAIRTHLD